MKRIGRSFYFVFPLSLLWIGFNITCLLVSIFQQHRCIQCNDRLIYFNLKIVALRFFSSTDSYFLTLYKRISWYESFHPSRKRQILEELTLFPCTHSNKHFVVRELPRYYTKLKAVACLAIVGVPVRAVRNIGPRDGVCRIWAARKMQRMQFRQREE